MRPLDKVEEKQAIKTKVKAQVFKGPSNERQEKVVEAFRHAWKAYREYAWGEDEVKPISKQPSSWFNLGLTIVDSLDTIYIMNLKDIYDEAREWILNKLSLDSDRYNNLFELTIRILGGLLSTYHLSGDELYLIKAYDVANRSINAFDTPSKIPLSDVNLAKRNAKSPHWTSDSSTSEVTTLSLEFNDLTRCTGDSRFENVIKIINKKIHELPKYDGLVPMFISTNTGRFVGNTLTLGARVDSYYEYLLKQWLQLGAKYDDLEGNPLLDDWIASIGGIKKRLLRQSKPNNYTYIGESIGEQFSPKMDHLVCYYSGNLALGAFRIRNIQKYSQMSNELLEIAEQLAETCYQMYKQTQTGLSPEIVYFNINDYSTSDIIIKPNDRHNLLRPETVESLYYLFKLTKKTKYQDYGWEIFKAFEKYTKVETGGYTDIDDVTNAQFTRPRDKMESFFLAETLKYFYLLFENSDTSEIDLNKWLFNTEAHLLPIYND